MDIIKIITEKKISGQPLFLVFWWPLFPFFHEVSSVPSPYTARDLKFGTKEIWTKLKIIRGKKVVANPFLDLAVTKSL